MKAVHNNKTYNVGWHYDKVTIDYDALGQKEVDRTTCFIKDDQGQIIGSQFIIRKHDDPYDKEQARVFSLRKTIKRTFSGKEGKPARIAISDAYKNRKTVK